MDRTGEPPELGRASGPFSNAGPYSASRRSLIRSSAASSAFWTLPKW